MRVILATKNPRSCYTRCFDHLKSNIFSCAVLISGNDFVRQAVLMPDFLIEDLGFKVKLLSRASPSLRHLAHITAVAYSCRRLCALRRFLLLLRCLATPFVSPSLRILCGKFLSALGSSSSTVSGERMWSSFLNTRSKTVSVLESISSTIVCRGVSSRRAEVGVGSFVPVACRRRIAIAL